MSHEEEVVVYEARGPAAWIALNRPHARNALSSAVVEGLAAGLDRAAGDPAVRAVVIAARGPLFCAGADLKAVRGMHGDPRALGRFLADVGDVLERIVRHPLPVIAAVHGGAIAGGLELVLACDLVIAAEEATFSDGHARYGLFPGGGGATRLPRRIGPARAKYLLFTGEAWSAETMRDCGLVNEVVPGERLRERVDALTQRIAAHSPAGLRRMKRLVDRSLEMPLGEALALEREACAEHVMGEDAAEGLAAFAERRTPQFAGR
jgi:enoyl-CoA hydratase